MSLRLRVALATAGAVAVAVLLASSVVYVVARAQLRGQLDDSLRGISARVLLEGGPPHHPGFTMPPPLLGGPPGYTQLVTAAGQAVRLPGARFPLPAEGAPEVARGEREAFFRDATVAGVDVRIYTRRVGPRLAAQVARPLDEVQHSLRRLAAVLALVSLGGIAAAGAAGLIVTRAVLSPVRRLTGTAELVARTHDLSSRIDTAGDDELARLARSFNAMLTALGEAEAAQRRLVADASHELRTPLTSLRTNAEVLERAGDLSPEERARVAADIRAQLEELSDLVADLVVLARGAEQSEAPEAVRLDEAAARAVERARRHAPGIEWRERLEPCTVSAGPAALERAVWNLLDNAAKWSPPGSAVDVEVSDGEIRVRDRGPGIDEGDLPHVFDRFYRAPAARAVPGSGLGLAIVRQVAEASGGSVAAERAEGGGARLRLRFSPTS